MRIFILLGYFFGIIGLVHAGKGIPSSQAGIIRLSTLLDKSSGNASRFNLKIQPAFFWASVGLEGEYVATPKMTIALNLIGKLGSTTSSQNVYPIRQEEFLNSGYLAELTGRYYMTLSKRKITLAPFGFYVQASVGYSKLLYFDGSTRPFTLHTRTRPSTDPRTPNEFATPSPLVGGLGAGYQIELVPHTILANIYLGTQVNTDSKGVFISLFVSPSIGMMF